jgi:uncharacterized membrane protein YkvI
MNTLPKLPKILSILLIFLLLVPFVLGAAVEAAPKYINLVIPIILIVVLAFGIVFYYNSKRKRPAHPKQA